MIFTAVMPVKLLCVFNCDNMESVGGAHLLCYMYIK